MKNINRLLTLFIFLISIFYSSNLHSQLTIGLGDQIGSGHAQTNTSFIQGITNADIVEDYYSNIWVKDYWKTDSVIVTANPYIMSWIFYRYSSDYTLHVSSAFNTQGQIDNYFYTGNYNKNALTVCGDYPQPNHPKLDLIIPISDYTNSQANSWASSTGAAMILNIIDTFRQVRGRVPFSYKTKALLLNTRTSSGFIDTIKAKQNIQNTLIDSMVFHGINMHTIPISNWYDSVVVSIYYHDTCRNFNDNLSLVDTVTIGGQRSLNSENRTFYNVSNDINLTVDYVGGDTIYFRENRRYRNADTRKVILIHSDSIKLLTDSLKSYYLIPTSGDCDNYGNDEIEFEAYNGNWTAWTTDSIVEIQFFYFQNDTLTTNDIEDIYSIGDTINLFECENYIHSIDTFDKQIKYALAWHLFLNQSNVPVELTRFRLYTPDPAAQTVFLDWQTASEQNNSHFEVQYSTNGMDFKTIGIVNGNGTTTENSDYFFVDKNPSNGINYYRLKQVDFNGQFEYSTVKSIVIEKEKGIDLKGNILRTTSTASIYNPQGQLITSFNHQFDITSLSSGIYFVRSENHQTFKFIKIY